MLCGMEKSEKGRRRASSSGGVVGQTRWERKGQGRGEGEGRGGAGIGQSVSRQAPASG